MSLRICIFGTSAFGIPSFTRLLQDPRFSVVGVISQPAKPTGRHQVVSATPVSKWAQGAGLVVHTPTTIRTVEIQTTLRSWKTDIFLVAAYGLILPQEILDLPNFGCLNIHASLLPKYRGASPISAAILQGDQETGITFIRMDAGCDTGPILAQVNVLIDRQDTRESLENTLAQIAAKSIGDTIANWNNKVIIEKPQSDQGVSTTPRLTRQSGFAVWDDAQKLERQIRAYQPWPGLWTRWKNHELKILAASSILEQPSEPPGTVVQRVVGWAIACRRGYLVPIQIQFGGKKPHSAKNIPGSYPGFIGSLLS